jgi:hypothetical protein
LLGALPCSTQNSRGDCADATGGYSVDDEEIEAQTEALRKKLLKESERGANAQGKKGLKMHQVHELAEAKIKQDDRFRSALGIGRDYEEGSHWKKQEERLRNKAEKEGQAEVKRED